LRRCYESLSPRERDVFKWVVRACSISKSRRTRRYGENSQVPSR
jgi:hypothetical protein